MITSFLCRFLASTPALRTTFRPQCEQLEDRCVPSVVPLGFSETTFSSGLSSPTAMEFAPDGRLFVAQKTGELRVITAGGTLLPTPFLTVNVNTFSERGLDGIAFDPNFSTNRFLYVYYTTNDPTPVNRVSRFTASSTDPNVVQAGSELVLLDNIPSTNGNHNGGALHFGNDGKLYIGVGEAGVPANSRTLANLNGKILRINSDGSIPSDNPFVSTPGARGEIWALGFRNPFTFNVDPTSGNIFVNDVGGALFEEIDNLMKGGDYGWMLAEGFSNIPGLINPISVYAHNGASAAITGGTFYEASQFPSIYKGSYFFADFINGFIRRLDGTTLQAHEFITGASSPVDLDVGPDGSLYYLSISSGAVFKITHVGLSDHLTVVGADAGGTPMVRLLDASNESVLRSFLAYDATFLGGVNVALGELTGDDIPDVITSSGMFDNVRVFDGATGELLRSFNPYPGFTGAAYVAATDINQDGLADIITGAGAGGGPHVKVFSGKDNSLLESFFAYAPGFTGGVRVAVGDFNGDTKPDIITAAGPGGGPHVKVFDGGSLAVLASFYAYDPSFNGGVWVAAGDLDANGKVEIITGAGAGGSPHVKVFMGGSATQQLSFFAYAPTFTGGVHVGAVDVDKDGNDEILTAVGAGGGPHVKAFEDKPTLQEVESFFAFDPTFSHGVFVGGD
jgi:glucose/arabinose dehydrogenase